MTAFGFLVGVGLIWFLGFMFVVQGLHRTERVIRLRENDPPGSPELALAQTRVQRGGAG